MTDADRLRNLEAAVAAIGEWGGPALRGQLRAIADRLAEPRGASNAAGIAAPDWLMPACPKCHGFNIAGHAHNNWRCVSCAYEWNEVPSRPATRVPIPMPSEEMLRKLAATIHAAIAMGGASPETWLQTYSIWSEEFWLKSSDRREALAAWNFIVPLLAEQADARHNAHYTVTIGQLTCDRLNAREMVTLEQADGGKVTLIHASDFPHTDARHNPMTPPDLRAEIDAILRNLGLAHSEERRIPPVVDRIMAMVERPAALPGAPPLEQIAGVIQAHSDKPEIAMSRWDRAAREIAALYAKAAPDQETRDEASLSWNGFNLHGDTQSIAEARRLLHADERLKQIEEMIDRKELIYPANAAPGVPAEIMRDLPRAAFIRGYMDDGSHAPLEPQQLAMWKLALWARSLPTPAPDPKAVELAKRLPSAAVMGSYVTQNVRLSLEDRQALAAAAAAGEQGA